MNIHSSEIERAPTREDAERALRLLRSWVRDAAEAEIQTLDPIVNRLVPGREQQAYPALSRAYPQEFRVDDAYKNTLPDLQNGPESLIKGAKRQIQHVGISNFRLPIRFRTRDRGDLTLETSVTGTVSLEAEKKGINMSRIMRTFYKHAEGDLQLRGDRGGARRLQGDLESFDARIQMRFSFPVKVRALRSGLEGWQYYDIALELVERDGVRKKIVHLDYVYSSTCPCSLELSEHARQTRGQLATPHSQRSVARLSLMLDDRAGACGSRT
jgi:GTP cyclohydrolase IB